LSASVSVPPNTTTAVTPRIEKIVLSPEAKAKVEKILNSGLRPVTKSNAMSKICGTCQCGNIPTLKLIYDCDDASRVKKYCEKCWQRIQRQDAEKWEKVYLDSAKYRAVQLLTDLQNCRNLCLKIAMDEKEISKDRIEAYKTACEASANIFKLVQEGPTFKTSIKQLSSYHNNNQESINNDNNDTDTKQLRNN
jgi:hypothetical protein